MSLERIGNMYGPDFTFLGVEKCDLSKPETFAGADIVIVGAPFDGGTTHRSGAHADTGEDHFGALHGLNSILDDSLKITRQPYEF